MPGDRYGFGVKNVVNAGLAADANAVVAAQSGLVFMGYSVVESAGTPAAASFQIVRGATVAGGTVMATEKLAASGSATRWFGPQGIECPEGISLDRVSGTVDIVTYYRRSQDAPV